MRRIGIGLLTLLLALPAARALDDPKDKDKDKPDKKPATPTEEYQALVKEFWDKQEPQEFAARFLKLAEDNAKDAVGYDAAAFIVTCIRGSTELDKALKMLAANHVNNPKIGHVCVNLFYSDAAQAGMLLRDVLEKNPDKQAQGMACYSLARFLKYHSQRAGNDSDKMSKEAESLWERAAEKYGDVKFSTGSLADLAKRELFEIRHLAIGKTAPDIEGEDIDGKKFKLSDYRGKVVVLDFWGNW